MNKNCKFTKQELERLGRSQADIDLVQKCQKLLPILFDNDEIAKFSVNAIDLWNQLGSKNEFSHWAKSNILHSDNVTEFDYEDVYCKVKSWVPNNRTNRIDVEFIAKNEAMGLNPSQLSANGITKSYMLTLDCSKDIAMYVGALPRTNKETKELSKMYRKYFRIVEEIVQQNKEWWETRDPEKIEYINMSEAVNAWCFRIWNRKAYKADYAVEADMLNLIVSGKTSKELKSELGISTFDLLRDYLKKDHNEELLFLEKQNQVLLAMDMGFTERKNMLTKMHEVTFKNKVSQRVA